MLKLITTFSILLSIVQVQSQVMIADSTKLVFIEKLELRIPEAWQVEATNEGLKIFYVPENGIYAKGCCSAQIVVPTDKKLLNWLRNDYLKATETNVNKLSDTLSIQLSFMQTWSKEKLDSAMIMQDSLRREIRSGRQKKEICANYFWDSNNSKQIIPFFSNVLNSAVFYDRPTAFDGIYTLDYEFGIPRFISVDEDILMIEQITALMLGINENCFTCSCKEGQNN